MGAIELCLWRLRHVHLELQRRYFDPALTGSAAASAGGMSSSKISKPTNGVVHLPFKAIERIKLMPIPPLAWGTKWVCLQRCWYSVKTRCKYSFRCVESEFFTGKVIACFASSRETYFSSTASLLVAAPRMLIEVYLERWEYTNDTRPNVRFESTSGWFLP